MITYDDFAQIDKEVNESIDELLTYIFDNCRDHNYILLLANGHYMEDLVKWGNPYVIDYFVDKHKDESRMKFFSTFMQTFYSFPHGTSKIDNEFYLHIELMVYSHIWESKPFLRQLYKLAYTAVNDEYEWDAVAPDMGKHDFIRYDIRDAFASKKLKIADVISKGFHTSLRNAFAHSEYRINEEGKYIYLDNYHGKAWEIRQINYSDWTKKFIYSALLTLNLSNQIHRRRIDIINKFNRDKYLIIHPINPRRFRVAEISYNLQYDRFTFKAT
jgi:hypothetical protein